MINKTKVHLVFDQTAGTNNRVAQNSAIKRSGWAWINDISISAQNRQNSQLTCTIHRHRAFVLTLSRIDN